MSRKVGPATHRNRLRRLYREAFRLTRHDMPTGLDLILIPRKGEEKSRGSARARFQLSANNSTNWIVSSS